MFPLPGTWHLAKQVGRFGQGKKDEDIEDSQIRQINTKLGTFGHSVDRAGERLIFLGSSDDAYHFHNYRNNRVDGGDVQKIQTNLGVF